MTEWKAIPDFEGYYEASDAGDIRRIKGGKGAKLGACLKGKVGSSGYHEVCLAKEGRHYWRLAHRLVAQAFLGDSDLQVNHKNFDKLDNRIENLEYVTQAENNQHCIDAGRGRWANEAFDPSRVRRDEQGRFAA